MKYEQLKLENQVCFPVYAASRLIIREYQPLLDKLHLTYPQYLVLMVLWENDCITVNEISRRLILNTNTVTPLLKRMEALGLIRRLRSGKDERKVMVSLTDKGIQMEKTAASIPASLISKVKKGSLNPGQLMELRDNLYLIINLLNRNHE